MVGLVIASHGHLAQELVATAVQIIGELHNVATLSVEPGVSSDGLRDQMKAAVASVEQGQGVIVMADLLGGTPCTQGLTLCAQGKVEVVTGVNLPMLIKANSLRATPSSLSDLAHQLASYGQKNICCPSDALRPQQ